MTTLEKIIRLKQAISTIRDTISNDNHLYPNPETALETLESLVVYYQKRLK